LVRKKIAGGIYLQNTRDELQNSELFVSACSDQETDKYPLRGLSNIRKLTYSIDPSVPWSEPL
jgi:hypothetical protein